MTELQLRALRLLQPEGAECRQSVSYYRIYPDGQEIAARTLWSLVDKGLLIERAGAFRITAAGRAALTLEPLR